MPHAASGAPSDHLDTSFLIRALVRGSLEDGTLRRWLAGAQPIGIAAIAWTEFLCGPLDAHALELASRVVGEPVPFTGEGANVAANLFNSAGRRRGTLLDCMVAAVAIQGEAELATANAADFRRFTRAGLRLATLAG